MEKKCENCNTSINENEVLCLNCKSFSDSDDQFEPIVELTRASSLVGCFFNYRVFIDNKEIGSIKNGEKVRFKVSKGLHEMHIKQNWSWFYSPKVSFLHKDFTKLTCRPRLGLVGVLFKSGYYALFKSKKMIILEESRA